MTVRSICIVGPGAIGGMMALKLKRAGYDVCALARPVKATEIKTRGMTLHSEGATITEMFRVESDPAKLGPQDLVVVTTKAGALPGVVGQLPALSKPETPWLFVLNGVPWWFLDHIGGKFQGRKLATIDDGDVLRRAVPDHRMVWGVIHCGVSFGADGSLNHQSLNQLYLGRADNSQEHLADIAAVFRAAGYNTEVSRNIHGDIWHKLQNNATFNPISAVTMATTDLLLGDPLVRDLCVKVADETRAIGEALGIPGGPTGEQRFPKSSPRAGVTSMMSDMLRGRPMETDQLIGVVVELSEITGVPAPFARMLYGLTRLRARTAAA
ncbi:MAG: 2-dehydropantoate 2-reductase [Alphaproteobacteria bacterium]|nr:2-dehydropantoate 2-reductase [Alphaproteobacteria bacterium]